MVTVTEASALYEYLGYGLELRFELFTTYECRTCRLWSGSRFTVGVASHMVQHLQRHLDAGQDVPKEAIDTARRFAVAESQETLSCGLTR